MDIVTYALLNGKIKDYASNVDEWLEENVDPATGYVLDRSLQMENAAAPADMVGDINNDVGNLRNTLNQFVRPNLLDNWYFVYGKAINNDYSSKGTFPVNQRGQTSYSNAGYTVDRWKLTSGSVTVVSGGITLNGTLVQVLEASIGQTVTASALLSDGTMITPTYNDTTKTFTLTATGQTIKAAKLELGSGQTLAHQENGAWVLNEIPDYGEELAKCQRYYLPDCARFCIAYYYGAGIGDIIIPTPVAMSSETVAVAILKDALVRISDNGIISLSDATFSVVDIAGSRVTVRFYDQSISGSNFVALSANNAINLEVL